MRPIVAVRPIACAALAVAACTPMQWVKPEATPQQLSQDAAQCQQEAWREARFRAWLYRPIGPTIMQDAQGRRFFVWPASPFGDPFSDQLMEEARLASFCMRSKGYELVPAETIQPSAPNAPAGRP
ncbi:MAG: hypothetical protein E6H44_00525 [Betaproteobacteria bacterium]|nr:MAG: hypothetical protein E6H44_00525 [Betaproteobacteria bacterium]TMI03075.1 MAG: hypothetical protein E6H43_04960 [Betaproteobacteria bacterium]TMI12412.1 MAG: hypothetical protein E6H40_01960 [Betaproteobacteria bacterium]TMI35536.1 MAG: hypothetical protein E6H41_11530 [Betaproteobacteria bacterium]